MYKADLKYSNHAAKGTDDGGSGTPDKAKHTAMMRSSDAVLTVEDHRKKWECNRIEFC